jgi:hypothetical protein
MSGLSSPEFLNTNNYNNKDKIEKLKILFSLLNGHVIYKLKQEVNVNLDSLKDIDDNVFKQSLGFINQDTDLWGTKNSFIETCYNMLRNKLTTFSTATSSTKKDIIEARNLTNVLLLLKDINLNDNTEDKIKNKINFDVYKDLINKCNTKSRTSDGGTQVAKIKHIISKQAIYNIFLGILEKDLLRWIYIKSEINTELPLQIINFFFLQGEPKFSYNGQLFQEIYQKYLIGTQNIEILNKEIVKILNDQSYNDFFNNLIEFTPLTETKTNLNQSNKSSLKKTNKSSSVSPVSSPSPFKSPLDIAELQPLVYQYFLLFLILSTFRVGAVFLYYVFFELSRTNKEMSKFMQAFITDGITHNFDTDFKNEIENQIQTTITTIVNSSSHINYSIQIEPPREYFLRPFQSLPSSSNTGDATVKPEKIDFKNTILINSDTIDVSAVYDILNKLILYINKIYANIDTAAPAAVAAVTTGTGAPAPAAGPAPGPAPAPPTGTGADAAPAPADAADNPANPPGVGQGAPLPAQDNSKVGGAKKFTFSRWPKFAANKKKVVAQTMKVRDFLRGITQQGNRKHFMRRYHTLKNKPQKGFYL